jgi:DNA invertase Pin-like site-specific DNA recombinase
LVAGRRVQKTVVFYAHCYARVSTQDQNPALQIDALTAGGCEEIYEEKISSKIKEREQLEQCFRTLRSGDVLVVWRLDRLGRSLKDLVEIISTLDERGVGFQSLTEQIDTTTASGKLVFHIFGALAEFEHTLIRERTKAGLAAARARGRKGGRKPSMSKSAVKKAAAMLRDPLMTKKEVAAHFEVSRVTLNESLKRHGYPLNPAST